MEIRFAQAKDIPALIDLLRQVGQIHREGRPDLFREAPQKFSAQELETMLQQENQPIFVAAQGEKVLGYAFCSYKLTEHHPVLQDRKTLFVEDFCVDEKVRGQGIGGKLFREVQAYGRALGFQAVTLNVWQFNRSAMEFYLGLGMKPQRTIMESLL